MTDLHRSLASFRAALDDIKRMYAEEEDTEALRDTALGETTLEEDILRALRQARERQAMAAGIEQMVSAMQSRISRLRHGAESLRAACLQAMQEAGIEKIPAPDMTVGIGLSPAKVIVTVEAARLADRFRRFPPPEPDKKAIADALKRGETVEGAELSNRAPFLRISTK